MFASPLDLNVENGAIEQPLKPMIRFGTPVFDDDGQRKGIVLLDYFGAEVLDAIGAASNSSGNVMVVNSDGYFLRGESADQEWGFMYEEHSDATFENAYPEAATGLGGHSAGVVETNAGLFVMTTVRPVASADETSAGAASATGSSGRLFDSSEYYWAVVARVSPEALAAGLQGVGASLVRLFAILIALLAVGSFVVSSLATGCLAGSSSDSPLSWSAATRSWMISPGSPRTICRSRCGR